MQRLRVVGTRRIQRGDLPCGLSVEDGIGRLVVAMAAGSTVLTFTRPAAASAARCFGRCSGLIAGGGACSRLGTAANFSAGGSG